MMQRGGEPSKLLDQAGVALRACCQSLSPCRRKAENADRPLCRSGTALNRLLHRFVVRGMQLVIADGPGRREHTLVVGFSLLFARLALGQAERVVNTTQRSPSV